MKAYIFPGQGAQFSGMGLDLYQKYAQAKEMFEKANEILGFRITDIMFEGSDEELKKTKVTQPAIFLHSVIMAEVLGVDFKPDMVAGHSLGEFSALVANKCLSFEDGLSLVYKRALAMQKACEIEPSTMAAILGMEDAVIEETCQAISDVVVAANYNSPGQVVISGSVLGIDKAIALLTEKGAKKAVKLQVSGAFHSPLMEPARQELEAAICQTKFNVPICPIYQNVNALAVMDAQEIKNNLILQLTSPVKWTQTAVQMIADGANEFVEIGPGKVLQGLIKKIDRKMNAYSAEI